MVHLLDVNLLIALAWPNHLHHVPAHAWFAAHAAEGWATCPITQCGFVRVSSNPRVIHPAVSPGEAVASLRRMAAHPYHVFWPDDVMLSDSTHVPLDVLRGHQQVTDAYMVGVARRRGGRLATMDRGLLAWLPQGMQDAAVLVPT